MEEGIAEQVGAINVSLKDVFSAIQSFLCKLELDDKTVVFNVNEEKLHSKVINTENCLTHLNHLMDQLQKIKKKTEDEVSDHLLRSPEKKLKTNCDHVNKHSNQGNQDVDWSLVQVTADNTEIQRRISSFIQRKHNEVDLLNRREFCNVVDNSREIENSCARTDAVFVPRLGQRSHIKVTRVNNTSTSDEAQTLDHVSGLQWVANIRQNTAKRTKITCTAQGVNERVRNMEQHLGLSPGCSVTPDIYVKLQQLERRILYLEGLSPEYFSHNVPSSSRGSASNDGFAPSTSLGYFSQSLESMSINAIDERIKMLKESLLEKRS